MIPSNGSRDIEIITYPSRTYRLNKQQGRIMQYADGIEAVKQMCEKALSTKRYKYEIYNWNYGLEVDDLFTMPTLYVKPELERRIKECLLIDDRVQSVSDFRFTVEEKTVVTVSFTVTSIFGDFFSELNLKNI